MGKNIKIQDNLTLQECRIRSVSVGLNNEKSMNDDTQIYMTESPNSSVGHVDFTYETYVMKTGQLIDNSSGRNVPSAGSSGKLKSSNWNIPKCSVFHSKMKRDLKSII